MGRNNRWRLGSAAQSHEQRCDRQQNSDRSEFFENCRHCAIQTQGVRKGWCQSSCCSGFKLTGDHPSGSGPARSKP